MNINLEEFFLSTLRSNEKLEWYLKHNVNVVNYIDAKWPEYMAIADLTLALIPKDKIKRMLNDITSKRILEIIEKERPDLYKTITTHPNGRRWLVAQIGNFHKRFL
jgi:hypothetical protein